MGGGKWRGHGWVPWKFTKVGCGYAGEKAKEMPLRGIKVHDGIPFVLPEEV